MTALHRTVTACATAFIAGGTLIASPPADAASSTSPNHSESVAKARANVTDIRQVVNNLPVQVQISNMESGAAVTVQPNSTWNGSMWIPWASNSSDVKDKSIRVFWNNFQRDWLYHLYQDYLDSNDQIRWGTTPTYSRAGYLTVGGSSTGGGRKSLIIHQESDSGGAVFWMENVG